MPVFDYKCNQCDCKCESSEDLHGAYCGRVILCYHLDCGGVVEKKFAFAIGRIEGAGGSPARKS